MTPPITKEQFLARWDKTAPDGHWFWTGYINPQGYGRTSFGRPNRTWNAHVALYELLVGPVPEGLQLDHLCRVRHCGNPEHLEPVTCRENLLRGETWAARNAAKTHCKRGHPYDEANTRIIKTGGRSCRTCSRERMRGIQGYKGNLPAGQRTHCPKGHPYDSINTRWYGKRRYCKACEKLRGTRPTRAISRNASDGR